MITSLWLGKLKLMRIMCDIPGDTTSELQNKDLNPGLFGHILLHCTNATSLQIILANHPLISQNNI